MPYFYVTFGSSNSKHITMTYVDYLFVSGLFLLFVAANYFQQKVLITREKEKEINILSKEKEKLENLLKAEDKKLITPMRLQAYERMVLFLERITPHSMIFRVQKPGMNVLQLQTSILQNIRQEYEHNQAQQLYISNEAWSMAKTAKEELVRLVNNAASKVQPEEDATALSKEIFASLISEEKSITDRALTVLKKDIQALF